MELLQWSGCPLHRENSENGHKLNRENTLNLEILPTQRNTGNCACSSCQFPDSEDIGYCFISCKSFPMDGMCLLSLK